MTYSTIFFDLDDTLYPASSGLWPVIKDRILQYMHERLEIPAENVAALSFQYYRQYGTSLRGLQANYQVDTADYLAYVHDVPLADYIHPNPTLRSVLTALPARKFIFTNADVNHARRVTRLLGLEDCFDGIVDVVAIDPYCKPMPQSFETALKLAGESDPRRCVMIDDLPHTTRAAREQGLFSLLFGATESHPDADRTFSDWSLLPALLNGRH